MRIFTHFLRLVILHPVRLELTTSGLPHQAKEANNQLCNIQKKKSGYLHRGHRVKSIDINCVYFAAMSTSGVALHSPEDA